MTRPAISQHIGVLRGAGLVEERREGARRLYHARPAAVAELRDYLSGFWGEGLGQPKDAAEATAAAMRGRGADAD